MRFYEMEAPVLGLHGVDFVRRFFSRPISLP
jgi:hypothetical protein